MNFEAVLLQLKISERVATPIVIEMLFKGAVVTTKPRRRRRGRGAAAVKTEIGWMGGEVTPRWPREASRVLREWVGTPTEHWTYIYIYI